MKSVLTGDRLAPKVLVFAPLVVLSAIFAAYAVVSLTATVWPGNTIASTLIAMLAAFAIAVLLFGRFGLSQVSHLEHLGRTDSLSLLPNRRALHEDVRRFGKPGEELAIALIDLDGFKLVNDHYGHIVGDQLIREAADILREVCGEEARCYRLGGDEFAVSMMGPLSATIVEGISRKIVERFGQPIHIDDRRIAVGASIGLARSSAKEELSSSELLRRADVAMYASKRGGKMRCTWFRPEFDRDSEAIRRLDADLRNALAQDEFRVLYQPLVDARTKRVVAVESLIRWERPDGKPVGPAEFIPVAEQSGLINAIGLWVLRRACSDAKAWDEIKLSVNISAAQLRNPEFPIQLGQILEETGFAAERLELEITETCLVLDPAIAERSLNLLREFGVNVVLDDFGTGYASIGFLRQFKFEKLKLDRSLVVRAGEDDGSRAMMLSSITVARAMKMAVTAEGVETEAQADLVRAAGCDQIQGWLYFKAIPAEEIEQHLTPTKRQANSKSTRAA